METKSELTETELKVILWLQQTYEEMAFDIHEIGQTKTVNIEIFWERLIGEWVSYKLKNNIMMMTLGDVLKLTGEYKTSLGDIIYYEYNSYKSKLMINGKNIYL